MNRPLGFVLLLGLAAQPIFPVLGQTTTADAAAQSAERAAPTNEAIDFARARQLMQRRRSGEKLSADEQAFLRKAHAAHQSRGTSGEGARGASAPGASAPGAGSGSKPALTPKDKTGLVPLTDMTVGDVYKGEEGGLYGGGQNDPPPGLRSAAEKELARIKPLDANGAPDPKGGLIGFISISMSNATQEFSRFKSIADRDPAKSPRVKIVDCAQGGQAMAEWAPAGAPPWSEAERRLKSADLSPQQVQVAWIKIANKQPSGDLAEHGRQLERDTIAVIQQAQKRFPNLRVVYLSSRIYGGYTTGRLNPEPYAYESAFVVRWLIQDQMKGVAGLNHDPTRGEVRAPLLLWGPYLWADGITPRKADQLIYSREDLGPDGTHPSAAGRDKVARQLLEFLKNNPMAKPWFIGDAAH